MKVSNLFLNSVSNVSQWTWLRIHISSTFLRSPSKLQTLWGSILDRRYYIFSVLRLFSLSPSRRFLPSSYNLSTWSSRHRILCYYSSIYEEKSSLTVVLFNLTPKSEILSTIPLLDSKILSIEFYFDLSWSWSSSTWFFSLLFFS